VVPAYRLHRPFPAEPARPAPAPVAAAAPALVPVVGPGGEDGLLAALLAKLSFSGSADDLREDQRRSHSQDRRAFGGIGVDAERLGFLDPKRDEPLLTAKLSELGVGDLAVKLVPLESAPAETAPKPAAMAPRPAPPSNRRKPSRSKSPRCNWTRRPSRTTPLIQQAMEIFKAQLVDVRAPGAEKGVVVAQLPSTFNILPDLVIRKSSIVILLCPALANS
jgi:hypothetical protein